MKKKSDLILNKNNDLLLKQFYRALNFSIKYSKNLTSDQQNKLNHLSTHFFAQREKLKNLNEVSDIFAMNLYIETVNSIFKYSNYSIEKETKSGILWIKIQEKNFIQRNILLNYFEKSLRILKTNKEKEDILVNLDKYSICYNQEKIKKLFYFNLETNFEEKIKYLLKIKNNEFHYYNKIKK